MKAKPFHRDRVTGVVLAGGRGQRMGGVDKGLTPFRGKPLVQHAIERLSPQVGSLLVNANRNPGEYAQWGHRVFSDLDDQFAGPLSGMLAAMGHCQTPWLMCVPCDTPFFPTDLVARLFEAAQSVGAELALPSTVRASSSPQWQTVFVLMRADLQGSLRSHLERGERKVDTWVRSLRHAVVPFDDDAPFANINTLDELKSLESP